MAQATLPCRTPPAHTIRPFSAKPHPPLLPQVIFFRKAFWRKCIVPLVLTPLETKGDAASTATEASRAGLAAFLVSKGMLKPPPPPQRAAPVAAAPREGRQPDVSAPPPPLGWAGLLEALPLTVVRGEAQQIDYTIGSLAALLRVDAGGACAQSDARGEGAGGRMALAAEADARMSVATVEGQACVAAVAAGGLAPLLQQLLNAFACCAGRASSLRGCCAPTGWATLFVRRLVWEPQLAWPALHRALWGWLRLAVAGRAGAHERPLALLLLSLGSMQRHSLAASRRAPAACPGCDEHARNVLHARARGCAVGTLLVHLPISDARERVWTCWLAAACVAVATEAFDAVDVGRSPPEAWATPAPPKATERLGRGAAGGTTVHNGGEPAAANAASAPREPPPNISAAWLPQALPQLLLWLLDWADPPGQAPGSPPVGGASGEEREAAALVRCRLHHPPVAALLAALEPPSEQQVVRWQLLVGMEDAAWG